MEMLTGFVYMFFIGAIYFAPSIIAYNNKKKNKQAILMLNLFLGWTILGWIIALVWATCKD